MSFFEDMERALSEAIEIEKGNIPVKEKKGMPAKTFYVADNDQDLIDELIEIRKSENISQVELAEMTGSSQQSISRIEKKTHSPSMKVLMDIINALGYELRIVKKGAM